MAKIPYGQLKEFIKRFGRWLDSPAGQQAQKEGITVLSKYIQTVISAPHPLPPAEQAGHPHMARALSASSQEEWEKHLLAAASSYAKHISGQATYDNFIANFFVAVAAKHYGDQAGCLKHLRQTYIIGLQILDERSPRPGPSDQEGWDRFSTMAEVMDAIEPIVKRAGR